MTHYYQYPFLSEAECQEYIDFFKAQPKSERVLCGKTFTEERKHILYRMSEDNDLYKKFKDLIATKHKEISDQLGIEYKEDIRLFELWISEYRTGDIVAWHRDRDVYAQEEGEPVNPRLYNISVVLNEDFSGGELGLRTIKPKQTVTIPNPKLGHGTSFLTKHVHQVSRVTDGTRYVLIAWVYHEDPGYYKT